MDKKYINLNLAKAEFTGNFQSEYPTAQIHALLDSIPAADVVEVRHAHKVTHNRPISSKWVWGKTADGERTYVKVHDIIEHNPVDYCSACGKRLDDNFQNYCPNCGAKMEVDGE